MNKSVDEMLGIAKSICKDLKIPFELEILEFLYYLENRRIKLLRPSKSQMKKWSSNHEGVGKFTEYLERKTHRVWQTDRVMKLWHIYRSELSKKKRIVNRDEMILLELMKKGKLVCDHCGKNLTK